MTVVINEFEVVAEPPQREASAEGAAAPLPPQVPKPRDIERILERLAQRLWRLNADG